MTRALVLQMQVTLDGFVGGPDGDVNWAFPAFDDEFTALSLQTLEQAGVHIMGAETGKGLAAYWPAPTEARDLPFGPAMNDIPKVVFSRTLDRLDWNETRIENGDLQKTIADLKSEPGKDMLVHGGSRFAQSLGRLGLIDEYRLMVHPVALGHGLRLFPDTPSPLRFDVVEARPLQSGVLYTVLRPAAAATV